MKVLLVSTHWEQNPITTFETTDDESHYPIGLAYLHSYLESKGHEVDLLWANNDPDISRLIDHLKYAWYDVVGFNVLTMNRVSTYKAIEHIHSEYPHIKIILGGIHATLMYEQILKKYPYVVVIRGEGELTFAEVLTGFEKHTPLFDIPGIAYHYYNGMVVVTPDRLLIQNLDTLPFPKHKEFFIYRPVPYPRSRSSECKRTFAGILTSRGCPNQCSFCCLNPASKRTVRFRSIQNVVEEIEYLIRSFPSLKTIWIHDDSFFLNNQRVIDFCDEIIHRNIKIEFVCSGRIKPLSEEMVMKLQQAGFKTVMLGLESGDNNILETCHKGITQDDTVKAVELFAKTNIELALFLIVGLPGETAETIKTTANFIQELQSIKYTYYKDIGICMVYPGTEVYGRMKQAGRISDDYWLTTEPTPVYTLDHTEKTLIGYKNHLLDHIALERTITPNGFFHQWYMIIWSVPYVLKRLYRRFT